MSKKLTIEEITKLVMQQAEAKGFGTKQADVNVPEKIALIHSEIAEAYEAYRRQNIHGKDGLEEELGDAIQRILHLAGIMNLDIEAAVINKLRSNQKREWDWDKLNEGKG